MVLSFLFTLFTFTAQAAPVSGCAPFNGHYAVGPEGCYTLNQGRKSSDYVYSGLKISADDSPALDVYYEEGAAGHGFLTAYIADGQEHNGDVYNTGKTYTASCANGRIYTVRKGMLIAPLAMSFAANADGTYTLDEIVTTADPFTRSCSMVRVP